MRTDIEIEPGTRLKADELRALSVRRDLPGLVQLAGHLGALCATGALVLATKDGWWVVPALFLHGYVLDFLFCLFHEAVHYTPFRSRWISRFLGHAVGFLLVLPFEYFRLFHWDHHRYTQDPARDPELVRPLPANLAAYLLHMSGLPNWKTRLSSVGAHALTGRVAQPWVPAARHAQVVREARVYVLGYAALLAASLWFGTTLLLWLWILPAMAGQVFLRNYLLAEHTGCGAGSDPLANTRTTRTNFLVRFLAWNMPYHAEHHAYPAIPFHCLPAANRRLGAHVRVVDAGYLAALRSILRFLFKPDPASAAARVPVR